LIIAGSQSNSFDASVSVKWSVVGWNRPETVEFLFFAALNSNYQSTTLYYGRIDSGGAPSPTNTPTATFTPTKTPTLTPVPTNRPTNTPTATNTPTSTPSPTASTTGGTLTRQIAARGDDVNQDGSALQTSGTTIWLGNATSTNSSYTGLRFTNITIPKGAVITSAHLEFYSVANQWISISMQIAADAADNSAPFSSTSLPSQRTRTNARVTHSSNVSWSPNVWYSSNDIHTVVQEVVNRSGWHSGNSLSIILVGTGGIWGRKSVASYEANPAQAVRLVVTYR
jgi:hypothetical protein